MLMLLKLPLTLLRIGYYWLWAVTDSLRGHKRFRVDKTVAIGAPREAVWALLISRHVVFDGPPVVEMITEPLADDPDLGLTRVLVNGQETGRVVMRELARDEIAGTMTAQQVRHELTWPAELDDNDCLASVKVVATPQGSTLTMHHEVTARSVQHRISHRLGVDQQALWIKQKCEKDAGTESKLAAVLNHGLLLSLIALLSFWYLVGWQDALLLAVIVVLHEAGHALAMRMVGVEVHGIYLVPFFGGAAVPKSAYRSEFDLGFVALMGPGFSVVPTFALMAAFWASSDARLLMPISMFAFINAVNLLPIYPLDGGLILNSLLGSVDRRLALVAGWIGVMVGLGAALFFKSWLIGIPFLLFALQRYLTGGRTGERRRLSFIGAAALVLGFALTFGLHVFAFTYAEGIISGD
jgi:Zn-dependent protease